jgi:small subunit ribosomal protein S4
VNGKVVNIASSFVKPGDVVGVREKSKSLEIIVDCLQSRSAKFPWFEWDQASLSGRFIKYPERAEIPENIKEQLIVELYSK